jgi:hypothetical protein
MAEMGLTLVHSYFLDQISSIWSKANVQAMALGN